MTSDITIPADREREVGRSRRRCLAVVGVDELRDEEVDEQVEHAPADVGHEGESDTSA